MKIEFIEEGRGICMSGDWVGIDTGVPRNWDIHRVAVAQEVFNFMREDLMSSATE